MGVQCFTRRKEIKALAGYGVSGGLKKWLTRIDPREYRHPSDRASGETRRHQIREPRPARTQQLQGSLLQSLSQMSRSFFQAFDMCPRWVHATPPFPSDPQQMSGSQRGREGSRLLSPERMAARRCMTWQSSATRDGAETVCPSLGCVPNLFY